MRFVNIFKEIESKDKDLLDYLKKHQSKHKKQNHNESLYEHSLLVKEIFLKINNERGLESLYDNLIKSIFSKDELSLKLKKVLCETVFYHDLGKINPYFQQSCKDDVVIDKEKSQHSKYSYYLLLLKNAGLFQEHNFESFVFWTIFKTVSLHHMSLEYFSKENYTEDFEKLFEDEILRESMKNPYFDGNKLSPPTKKWKLKIQIKDRLNEKSDLFFLIKLFYSHLVLSDFFATLKFTQDSELNIRKIDNSLRNKLNQSFFKVKEYNRKFYGWNLKKPTECVNLNECRMNLLVQASNELTRLLEETDNRVFMLNVPTGGGKTNIAIKLMLDVLNAKKSIDKAFWVFPYINIIEQNYEVIKETLSLDNESITKIHSSENTMSVDESESLLEEFNLFLDTSLLNYPINIISSVNFFNTFFKNKKYNRYKTTFFVNSVVIIDEVQTLPSENLDLFYELVDLLAKKYNMYFIIMSATLPDLNIYLKKQIPHLIPNYEEYFTLSHFQRNEIIIEKNNPKKIDSLLPEVIDSLNKFDKILVVLNTISSSILFFEKLRNEVNKEVSVFLLNSLTQPFDRTKIINYVKQRQEKIILVSTQSIEAGVDLDFDCGFRDYSPLDSIEQVAGRINRESDPVKRKYSFLKVISLKNENGNYFYNMVYRDDPRIKITEKVYIGKRQIYEEMEEILNQKKFRLYYEELNEYVKSKKDISEIIRKIDYINQLEFDKISTIDVIKTRKQFDLYLERPIKIEYLETLINLQKKFNVNLKLFERYNEKEVMPILSNAFLLIHELKEKKEFLLKPCYAKIHSFLDLFKITLFNYGRESEEELIQSLISKKIIDDNRIINRDLRDKIIKKYDVKGDEFYYLDIDKIKKMVFQDLNKENESMII